MGFLKGSDVADDAAVACFRLDSCAACMHQISGTFTTTYDLPFVWRSGVKMGNRWGEVYMRFGLIRPVH